MRRLTGVAELILLMANSARSDEALGALRERIQQHRRFHQIDFGDGVAVKSVLDIGCWDGFFSTEAAGPWYFSRDTR